MNQKSFDFHTTPTATGSRRRFAVPGHKREYQRRLMAAKRSGEQEVRIRPISPESLIRKRTGRRDQEFFCHTYFPHIFYNPFTPDQRRILAAVNEMIHIGGCQAVAAVRGDGKTSIVRAICGVWAIVYGILKYLVLLGANETLALENLHDIKNYYEFNDLLAMDFPEVCDPIRALEGAPQRARAQRVGGRRTRMKWSGKEIIFPRVSGSMASSALVKALGLDAAIRGLIINGRRPDFFMADDIETRQSAHSLTQTKSRKEIIERDVLGSAAPDKPISVVLLCTIIKADCLADQLTDRERSPAWNGLRLKFLVEKPAQPKLWDKYIELRHTGQIAGDKTGRDAFDFYKKNKAKMDLGAQLNNPYRFIKTPTADGTPLEISALQHAYNLIADHDWDAFNAEYQNDPPVDSIIETSGLTWEAVSRKINRLERGVVPAGTEHITVGVDIGGRLIHWVVIACRGNMIGSVIDYGTHPVHSPTVGKLTSPENKESVEAAIFTALEELRDRFDEALYPEQGAANVFKSIDVIGIDSGWMPDPVYVFCSQTKEARYRPVKGFGTSTKMGKYRPPRHRKGPRLSGNHWHAAPLKNYGIWLYHLDADYFKIQVQNGFQTPGQKSGSLELFGTEPVIHKEFGQQTCAEAWVREFIPPKGWVEGFVTKYHHNHFLDSASIAASCANMLGHQIIEQPKSETVTLSERQKQNRQNRD